MLRRVVSDRLLSVSTGELARTTHGRDVAARPRQATLRLPAARTQPPRLRHHRRARLDEKLAALWDLRLGLVVAPPGAGKTTLLVQCTEACASPVAWYRAEAGDDSADGLLAGLEQACTAAFQGVPGSWESPARAARALESWPGPRGLLIVDDLHAIRDSPGEDALGRLLTYLPPTISVLLASRRSPSFDLSRLRIAGELLEIGPEDLRFRSWEVESLFDDFYGDRLAPEDLAELARRTEGWSAGLQLFHLATSGKPPGERRRILAGLGAHSREVREYLARNVLGELPPELDRFLVRTCVLGLLTGKLCDQLLGERGGAERLRELEARQMFTNAVDDQGTYRYHEVLRSHLEALLVEAEGEDGAALQYRRAAELLEAAGATGEAVQAYCRGGDWPSARRLLGRESERLVDGLGTWADLLPPGFLEGDPWLLLARARQCVAAGRLAAAASAYEGAELGFRSTTPGAICRRERLAVAAWIEPGSAAGPGWVEWLRHATRRDPGAAAEAARGSTVAPGRLAEGLAACLAGRLRHGRQLLLDLAAAPETSAPVVAGARLAAAIAGQWLGEPDNASAALLEAAERAGSPWLVRVSRAVAGCGAHPAGLQAGEARAACRRQGDDWGFGVISLVNGMAILLHGGLDQVGGEAALEALNEAAEAFSRVDAGVCESWARSAYALAAAALAEPLAGPHVERLAGEAERLARRLGAFGPRALACLAESVCHPERRAGLAAMAMALAPDTELIDRVAAALRCRAEGAPTVPIGTEGTLVELEKSLEEAERGSGGLVTLAGEPGTGKTPVLQEFCRRARHVGAWVATVSCKPEAPPYWPWQQIVQGWEQGAPAGEARAVLRSVLDRLRPDGGDAEAERDRAGEIHLATRALLCTIGRRRLLVAAFDDLHLADPASLRLLAFLGPQLRSVPALAVAGHRRLPPGSPVAEALATAGVSRALELQALDEADVDRVLAGVLARAPSRELVAAVRERTGGNPLLVSQTAQALAHPPDGVDCNWSGQIATGSESPMGGAADPTEGAAGAEAVARLPEVPAARDVVSARLALLGEDSRALLELASVVGDHFDLDLLEAVYAHGAKRLTDLLEPAIAARVVVDSGAGQFRFSSPLARCLAYEAIPPVRRSTWHRKVGEALERMLGERAEHPLELARHFTRAGVPGERRKAIAYSLAAADHCLALGRAAEAHQHALSAMGMADRGPGRRDLGECLLSVGRAQLRCGWSVAARQTLTEAAEVARGSGDGDLLARTALATAEEAEEDGVSGDSLLVLLDEARSALGPAASMLSLALSAHLARVHALAGRTGELRSLCAEVAAGAELLDDPRARMLALELHHRLLRGPEASLERLDAATEIVRLAEQTRDRRLVARARHRRLRGALELGDMATLDVELEALSRLAERDNGSPEVELRAARSTRALLEGRLGIAERLARSLGTSGDQRAQERSTALLSAVWVADGRMAEAEAELRQVAERRPSVKLWRAALALCCAEGWRREGAATELERFVTADVVLLGDGPDDVAAAYLLALVAARTGDQVRAASLYRTLAPWDGRVVVAGTGPACLGVVADALARLAVARGQMDLAAEHLEAALALEAQLGAPALSAATVLGFADALAEAGKAGGAGTADQSGRARRIRPLLLRARASADELGMSKVVSRFDAHLAVPTRTSPAALPASLPGHPDPSGAHLPASAPQVLVRCLGGFHLEADGRPVDLSGVKPRPLAALRLLAMSCGRPVHREILVEALWPEAEPGVGAHRLQVAVSSLRRVLAEAWRDDCPVVHKGSTYRLALPKGSVVDIAEFDSAVADARSARRNGGAEASLASLTRARLAYAGDLLPEDGGAEWVVKERQRLRLAATEVAETLGGLLIASGEAPQAASACEWGLQIDPYHDPLWRLLARAHEEAGDPAAAQRARRSYDAALVELGLPPSVSRNSGITRSANRRRVSSSG